MGQHGGIDSMASGVMAMDGHGSNIRSWDMDNGFLTNKRTYGGRASRQRQQHIAASSYPGLRGKQVEQRRGCTHSMRSSWVHIGSTDNSNARRTALAAPLMALDMAVLALRALWQT